MLQINNINPSSKTKNQRLTDVHGSLKAKDALKLASEKRAEEQKKEEKRGRKFRDRDRRQIREDTRRENKGHLKYS